RYPSRGDSRALSLAFLRARAGDARQDVGSSHSRLLCGLGQGSPFRRGCLSAECGRRLTTLRLAVSLLGRLLLDGPCRCLDMATVATVGEQEDPDSHEHGRKSVQAERLNRATRGATEVVGDQA